LSVATTLFPDTNDGAALGTGATAWSDLFLASGAVINFNNSELNITHTGTDLISVQGGSFGVHFDAGNVISGGSVGFSRNYITVDTEASAATDDLDTMTAPPIAGVLKWVQAANDARTVVVTSAGNIASGAGTCVLDDDEDAAMMIYNGTTSKWAVVSCLNGAQTQSLSIAASDETTPLTTGTGKVTWRAPYAFTVTGVRCSLTTAQASGSIFTVDINEAGTTIISTKVTIDNTEKTSTTAATAPVLSDTSLADDAELTIDIDQVGDGTAKGLKCNIVGRPT
jgi:hypothetical protein